MKKEDTFRKELTSLKEEIEKQIESFLNSKIKSAGKISRYNQNGIADIKEFTLRGGKRIRPILLYKVYTMLGGNDMKKAFKASIFMELMQTYALVHDDVIDHSDLRRGKPSMHKKYEKLSHDAFDNKDPESFGKGMAINIGDITAHIAFQALFEAGFSSTKTLDALKHAHYLSENLYHGQLLDILLENLPKPSEEYILKVQEYKTSVYTFQMPMQVGAMLAGCNKKDLNALAKISKHAGIAFQIKDDILGMFGEEEEVGKPADSDLKEGKMTLLILKALDSAKNGNKTTLVKALGNPHITKRTLNAVREIIIETGSLEYSEFLAEEHAEKAISLIKRQKNWKEKDKKFIIDVINFGIKRKS